MNQHHLLDSQNLLATYLSNRDIQLEPKLLTIFSPIVKQAIEKLAKEEKTHAELEVLLEAGKAGLLKAIRTFVPNTKPGFNLFATISIHGAATDALFKHQVRSGTFKTKEDEFPPRSFTDKEEFFKHWGFIAFGISKRLQKDPEFNSLGRDFLPEAKEFLWEFSRQYSPTIDTRYVPSDRGFMAEAMLGDLEKIKVKLRLSL